MLCKTAELHVLGDFAGNRPRKQKNRALAVDLRRGRMDARRSVAMRSRRAGPVRRGARGRRAGHGDLRPTRVARGPSSLKFKGSALSFVRLTVTFTDRGAPRVTRGPAGFLHKGMGISFDDAFTFTFTSWCRSFAVSFPAFVTRFSFPWWSFFPDPTSHITVPVFPWFGRAFPSYSVFCGPVALARCVE